MLNLGLILNQILKLSCACPKNIDKPGVIGKIGTILGDTKINIKEFLLSKKKSSELAFSVVRLDSIPSQQVIDQINSLDEVQSIQLLNC